jgi:hypothetical protein
LQRREYFRGLLNSEKEEEGRKNKENDQEETRTERTVIGEDEEEEMPTHVETERCIHKQSIIRLQEKAV